MTLISTIFALALFSTAYSQCTLMIPPSPGHIMISSDQTINDIDGNIYWICEGVTLTVSGSAGCIFAMEAASKLIINDSDGDQIYAKDNCSITDNSDESHFIGKNASATYVDNGSGMDFVTPCSPVIFDYSLVGGSSCVGSVGIEELVLKELNLYPSLIKANEVLYFGGNLVIRNLKIYDVSGKQVYSANQSQVSSIIFPSVPTGYYAVIATDELGNVYRNRLVVSK